MIPCKGRCDGVADRRLTEKGERRVPRDPLVVMKPQDARMGIRVKVAEHHRIEERRGLIGKVVGRYGGEEYTVVDVRFPDGRHRLFWPRDLEEEVGAPRSWWRSLYGEARVG